MHYIQQGKDLLKVRQVRHYVGHYNIKQDYQLVKFFTVVIRYFIREVIQATGKGQELLLGITINKFFLDTEVYVSPWHLQLFSES